MKSRLFHTWKSKSTPTLYFLLLAFLLLVPLFHLPYATKGSLGSKDGYFLSFGNLQDVYDDTTESTLSWFSDNSQFSVGLDLPDSSVLVILLLLQSGDQAGVSKHDSVTITNGKVSSETDTRTKQIEKLRGKTLDIYSLLIEEDRSFGIREIQRYFDYSSPNLATYHLEKLYQLDLIIKTDNNRYRINHEVAPIGEYQDKYHIFGKWVDSSLLEMVFVSFVTFLAIMLAFLGVSARFWRNLLVPLLLIYSVYQFQRQYKTR